MPLVVMVALVTSSGSIALVTLTRVDGQSQRQP